jgi:FkbH-like protein
MKLVEALNINLQNPARTADEPLTVALICGFTPLHLQTFLNAELLLLFPTRPIEMVTGQYDDIIGSLNDLRNRRFEAIALVLEWADVDARLGTRQLGGWSPRNLTDIVECAQTWLGRLRLLLEEVSQFSPMVVSLPTLPLPPLFFTAGWQASLHELRLRECLWTFAADVARNPRIRLISEQRLNLSSPMSARLDVRSNWLAGFPYHTAHASALAGLLSRAVQNPLPKKGLITDLDNTLWSGIVGDDGARNVYWDLDNHAQAHGLYQQFLRSLALEGVLIGAASKNDPEIVAEAFARPDILLPPENVFPFEVSWGSKALAVSQVLDVWHVHSDSVIFVDDDPLELAEVKAAHPAMECVQFPTHDPQAIYELVERLRDSFGRSAVSHEDEIRLESLRSNASARLSGAEEEGFSELLLEQANGELTFDFRKDVRDARALELINKTNQFNLNGKRFTESAWADYLGRDDTFLLTASYKDKFGALGKIAVLAGRVERAEEVRVETWVLSCRAFARRIEHHSLRVLFEKFKARSITFAYMATERNKQLTRFLAELLGAAPKPEAMLTASAFETTGPKLFHRVVGADGNEL